MQRRKNERETFLSLRAWAAMTLGLYATLVAAGWGMLALGWIHDRDPVSMWVIPALHTVPFAVMAKLARWEKKR